MDPLNNLRAELATLETERATLANSGWYLQHCWLVQVKPGGTARTDRYYWQVRSRQPFLTGKKLKHLQADEVEAYRTAIERGRQLQQLDRQIAKLQRRIAQLSQPAAPPLPWQQERQKRLSRPPSDKSPLPISASLPRRGQGVEQPEGEPAIDELLIKNQTLRVRIQQSMAQNQILSAENFEVRQQLRRAVRNNQARRQSQLPDLRQSLPALPGPQASNESDAERG